MPTDVDRCMQQVAIDMGKGESFNKALVGVTTAGLGGGRIPRFLGGVGLCGKVPPPHHPPRAIHRF